MKKRTALLIAAAGVAAAAAAYLYAGKMAADKTLKRVKRAKLDLNEQFRDMPAPAGPEAIRQYEKAEKWAAGCDKRLLTETTPDGLKLYADLFPAAGSHKWVIAVHGYTGDAHDMLPQAYVFNRKGYNVLTPDNRSHGRSDGDRIGMGYTDKLDILRWTHRVTEEDPEATIILYGISMGAAAVMMAAGEELPPNVAAVIEDCGYTSVWDEFNGEVAKRYKHFGLPLLVSADLINWRKGGYRFRQASAINAVRRSKLPILLIHGAEDTFVPTDMVYELYDAAPGAKELLVVPGAGHAASLFAAPKLYWSTVFGFLARVETDIETDDAEGSDEIEWSDDADCTDEPVKNDEAAAADAVTENDDGAQSGKSDDSCDAAASDETVGSDEPAEHDAGTDSVNTAGADAAGEPVIIDAPFTEPDEGGADR